VRHQLLPPQSLFTLDHQDLPQKLRDFLRSSIVVAGQGLCVKYLSGCDLVVQFVGCGGSVGNFAEDHLEEDHPDGPDVRLNNT
jgi:hypothetical protein